MNLNTNIPINPQMTRVLTANETAGSRMTEPKNDIVAIGPTSGLQYVRLQTSMAAAMEDLEVTTFSTTDPKDLYNKQEFEHLAADFPEGGVIGFDGDDRHTPIAAGLGIRVHFDFEHPQHRMKSLLEGSQTDSGDDPSGPWYYGTDIIVRPEYRRRGIGKELYDLRKEICRTLNLAGIIAGGVIPGYAEHSKTMSPDAYIDAVKAGRFYDPTLTFQLENGFDAVCALLGYMNDPSVNNAASLIVWNNPDYRPAQT